MGSEGGGRVAGEGWPRLALTRGTRATRTPLAAPAALAALLPLWLACGSGRDHGAAADSANSARDAAPDSAVVNRTTSADSIAGRASIADWLYLRTAAATRDDAARQRLYRRMRLPVARARIPWVEAAALERFGDVQAALAAYRALPAPVTVLRLRAAIAVTAAAQDSVRTDLLRLVAASHDAGTVREAYTVLDRAFPTHPAADELVIARAAARAGAWARASAGFARVVHGGPATAFNPRDRFAYADALARLGDEHRAAPVYLSVNAPATLATAARYQAARALLGSEPARSRAILQRLSHESDTSAANALWLLADLDSDRGNDASSRAHLLELSRRFPTNRLAAPARFGAALAAFVLGQMTVAAREFQSLAAASHDPAAAYWLGRAEQGRGDAVAARSAWRAVISADSLSYYAALARARLGTGGLDPIAAPVDYPHVGAVDSALTRIVALQRLGMSSEVGYESDALVRDALSDTAHDGGRLLATAAGFLSTKQTPRAIALGRRAVAARGPTAATLRLVYPMAVRDTILLRSGEAGIDPALVAGIIRQESRFSPDAVSPAGARGLMQLMPSVGAAIAARMGIRPWSAARLFEPGTNVTLGVKHLAPLLRSQPDAQHALAAYNAGESRVRRWSQKRGASDPDVFTERIPFAETRDYVRVVLQGRALYRALYAW